MTRQTVKPGTVYYDPNGHVLLVVKVENDGTIRMIDGHPDNSRDARFKASIRGIRRLVEQYAKPNTALARTLGNIWKTVTTTCTITYKSSAGTDVRLSLGQVEGRLFDLSFDPYHCPEMRWGAHPGVAAEMATCQADEAHLKRFDDERTQRNAVDRENGAPTPFGWGPSTPPDVNVTKLLKARGGI